MAKAQLEVILVDRSGASSSATGHAGPVSAPSHAPTSAASSGAAPMSGRGAWPTPPASAAHGHSHAGPAAATSSGPTVTRAAHSAVSAAGQAAASQVGSAVAGSAGAVGASQGLAAVAAACAPAAIAIGAVALGAIVVKKAFDSLVEDVEALAGKSADVALAQAQSQIRMEFAEFRRANAIGPQLAEFEKARGQAEEAMYDIGTEIKEGLLVVVVPVMKRIAELMREIADKLGIKLTDPFEDDKFVKMFFDIDSDVAALKRAERDRPHRVEGL